MSGHSKWATIRHKKGAADAKRGKVFTKIIKELTVAAKMGGGDPNGNPRLRTAVAAAKAANMPNDNIARAIKKGTGELEGVIYEDILYEGYGPGGVAVMVQILTDNKNRVVSEIRHIFSRHNGNLGESGCVAWMFSKKGLITVDGSKITEDKLMEAALDAGADDVVNEDGQFEVFTDAASLENVRGALESKGIPMESAEVSMIPQTYQTLTGKNAESMIKLVETLEDHDDVQKVFSNFDIDEKEMSQLLENE